MAKLSENIRHAYHLLFKGNTSEHFDEFKKMCEASMAENNTIVLYTLSYDFKKFVDKHGLDVGRKEVVITEDGDLRFSDDYCYRPDNIVIKDGVYYYEIKGWDGSTRYKRVFTE